MTLHPERVLAFGGEERRDDLRISDQRLCFASHALVMQRHEESYQWPYKHCATKISPEMVTGSGITYRIF